MQAVLPIACVDAFAIRGDAMASDVEIGLIARETPDEGRRWCLIGGRLFYGEAIADGLDRHVRDALGPEIAFATTSGAQPIYVAQYAPDGRAGFARDPRRHAIGLTFAITVSGAIALRGSEAVEFAWFRATDLSSLAIGFGQAVIIEAAIDRLRD